MSATRHNVGKARLSELLKFDQALVKVAAVMQQGAVKYAPDNWLKGGKEDSEYLDSAMRHIKAHVNGEYHDEETGCWHLAHAAWNLLACLRLNHRGPPIHSGFDQEAFEAEWAER